MLVGTIYSHISEIEKYLQLDPLSLANKCSLVVDVGGAVVVEPPGLASVVKIGTATFIPPWFPS